MKMSSPTTGAGATLTWPLLVAFVYLLRAADACNEVRFASHDALACQCNATHCDSLEFDWPRDSRAYLSVVSSKAGARFEQTLLRARPAGEEKHEGKRQQDEDYTLNVHVNKRQQQVTGFGGAFTDSASQMIGQLPEPVRSRLIGDYFGPRGLDYNMGRLPIAGTDMSTRPYSYDDLPEGQEDLELKHFRLQPEDLEWKIPLIGAANELRAQRGLGPLKLMAASWSAPAWMKSNNNLVQGKLRQDSSGAYYKAYARYIIRFLHEYELRNLSMWALSPQNEPLTPKRVGPQKINFNSVNFEPHEMVDYLEHSLVPELIRAGKTADKLKLFIWDDTLDGLERYQEAALSSKNIRDYAHGLALHWYTLGLNPVSYRHLYEVRRKLPPSYCLMSTEASFIGRPEPGEWAHGEKYARDLIENLCAGSVAWLDWNLALNMSGGPTWSHNYLDAAVLVEPERGRYYKNPMYYALGHLSRFIRPGAHIVATEVVARGSSEPVFSDGLNDELSVVAGELEEPMRLGDAQIARRLAVVLLNRVAHTKRIRLRLLECELKRGQQALEVELPANSITSLAFIC